MAKVIECTEGRYKVQDVKFGRVYRWLSESLVIECECGERSTLTASTTACGECGADHAATIREELATRWSADETLHPWRYAEDREDALLPF